MPPDGAVGYFAFEVRCCEKKFHCTSVWPSPDPMVSLAKGRDPTMPCMHLRTVHLYSACIGGSGAYRRGHFCSHQHPQKQQPYGWAVSQV